MGLKFRSRQRAPLNLNPAAVTVLATVHLVTGLASVGAMVLAFSLACGAWTVVQLANGPVGHRSQAHAVE